MDKSVSIIIININYNYDSNQDTHNLVFVPRKTKQKICKLPSLINQSSSLMTSFSTTPGLLVRRTQSDSVILAFSSFLRLTELAGSDLKGGNISMRFSALWFAYSGTEDRLQPIAMLLLLRCSKDWVNPTQSILYYIFLIEIYWSTQ